MADSAHSNTDPTGLLTIDASHTFNSSETFRNHFNDKLGGDAIALLYDWNTDVASLYSNHHNGKPNLQALFEALALTRPAGSKPMVVYLKTEDAESKWDDIVTELDDLVCSTYKDGLFTHDRKALKTLLGRPAMGGWAAFSVMPGRG